MEAGRRLMPFRSTGRWTWKIRVPTRAKLVSVVRSTGTEDVGIATEMEAMCQRFHAKRQWEVLDAIARKSVTLGEVFDAYERGTLPALLARVDDVELNPWITKWAKRADAKYVGQVSKMFTDAGTVRASQFTRRLVKAMLEALPVQDPTKNRYKAALSSFAKYLVEHEVIPHNPVREVSAFQENPPRSVWLTPEQVRSVVEAQRGDYRIAGALMAGAGLEWQAVERMTTDDVDLTTRFVTARGTKTKHRTRTVKVTEGWAWSLIDAHVRSLPKGSRLVRLSESQMLRNHKKVSKALGLPLSTLHDHRHSYAVQKIKQHYPPHLVRFQLGHAPGSRVLESVYALHTPTADDYDRADQLARKLDPNRTDS